MKIGAQDQEIQKALESVGIKSRSLDADLKKIGNTPLGQKAAESLSDLQAAMKGISDAQQRLADRASMAARGLEAMGGPARLTRSELDSMNKTIQRGLDAFRALGDTGSADLKRLETSAASVQRQLKSLQTTTSTTGSGLTASLSGALGSLPGGSAISAFANGGLSAGITAGASAGAAAFALAAQQAISYADAITKLSDKTGIGTEALQRLESIALASGNSLDQIGSAVSQFQNRLSSGDKQAGLAISEIGLSVAALKSLSPDEQFVAIAEGIQKIKDPADQTRLAMDLFGKSGAEILPSLKANVNELRDATVVMSADSVAALDRAGDAWDKFLNDAKKTAGIVVGSIVQENERLEDEVNKLVRKLSQAKFVGPVFDPGLDGNGPAALPGLGPRVFNAQDEQAAFNRQHGTAQDQMRRAVDALAAQLERQGAALDAVNKKIAASLAPLDALSAKQQDQILSLRGLGLSNAEVALKMGVSTRSVDAFADGLEAQNEAMRAGRAESLSAQASIRNLGLGYVKTSDAAKLLRQSTLALTEAQAAGFDGRDFLPSQDALGVGKTRNGKDILSLKNFGDRNGGGIKAFEPLEKQTISFSNFLEKQLSGAIVSAFQGGGNVSQSIGGTIGGFLSSTSSTVGSGISKVLSSTLGKTFGSALGSILPGLGTLAGGALGSLVGKLFGDPEKQINPIRQAFVNAAGGLDELNRRAASADVTLKALLDAKTPEQYQRAIENLNAAFAFQDSAMKTLDDTAAKYGFTLAELPQKFRQGKLDEQFLDLFKDQQILAAGGFEFDAVLQKQVDSFNDLIRVSLTTGATIPEQLRAAVQRLIEMGLATDDAGNALTDIGQLNFAETLDSKFGTLIDTIGKLVDAITRGLGGALQNLPQPDPIDVEVRYHLPGSPEVDGASTGGRVGPRGIQHFAGGGVVLPFFRSRGTDTVPAMLTPGEMVLNEAQQRNLAGALNTRGGAMVVQFVADGRTIAEMVTPYIPGVVKRYRAS